MLSTIPFWFRKRSPIVIEEIEDFCHERMLRHGLILGLFFQVPNKVRAQSTADNQQRDAKPTPGEFSAYLRGQSISNQQQMRSNNNQKSAGKRKKKLIDEGND